MPSISRIQKSGDRPRTSRVYATSSRTTLTGPDVEAGLLTPTMRLPQRTSWERPRRVDAGARFTRAMRKRAHGPSGHSDVVRGERLAPELGDARRSSNAVAPDLTPYAPARVRDAGAAGSRLRTRHRDTSPGGSYGTPGAGASAKGARMCRRSARKGFRCGKPMLRTRSAAL